MLILAGRISTDVGGRLALHLEFQPRAEPRRRHGRHARDRPTRRQRLRAAVSCQAEQITITRVHITVSNWGRLHAFLSALEESYVGCEYLAWVRI